MRLTPRASRDAIGAVKDGTLAVRVTAPPVDGATNAALIKLLAKHLRVPKSALRIASGDTSRQKVVEVEGVTAEELHKRLESWATT